MQHAYELVEPMPVVKQSAPASKRARLISRVSVILIMLLFGVAETNGTLLLLKRQELLPGSSLFIYLLPLFIALPLAAAFNMYRRLDQCSTEQSSLSVLRNSFFTLVLIVYAVLTTLMAILTNSLELAVHK